MSGTGSLTVTQADGQVKTYTLSDNSRGEAVEVKVGELMQWQADGDTALTFYEICDPPYEDGRFENLPE